jgi:fructose-specific phosphotransferase system IIC component
LAVITGVLFPFVVMFGILLAILFVFIHRLTVKIHRLESDSRLLLQELSLLKQTVDYVDDKKNRVTQAGPTN